MTKDLLKTKFLQLKADNSATLIGYLPAGYPDFEASISACLALVESGCDIIEIGIPYSDPVMDGPIIQNASQIAIKNGFNVRQVFDVVRAVSIAGGIPVVMGYFNCFYRYGLEKFAKDLKNAGGVGAIIPDLIPEEADEWLRLTREYDLASIFLAAQTSSEARLKLIATHTNGFIYATALLGVTGVRTEISTTAKDLVGRLKQITQLPVGVGLGISTPEQVRQMASFADGVIVGSALIKALDQGEANLRDFTNTLKAACHKNNHASIAYNQSKL